MDNPFKTSEVEFTSDINVFFECNKEREINYSTIEVNSILLRAYPEAFRKQIVEDIEAHLERIEI